jgi:hypothetical protein
MNIEGRDASYSETLARVAELMDSEKFDRQRIADLSTASAREYLNDAIVLIAQSMGIAAAKVAALIEDVLQITKNVTMAFADAYRKSYENARRIKPYGA